jgi:tetratricopeptide (TPR) repeat protein
LSLIIADLMDPSAALLEGNHRRWAKAPSTGEAQQAGRQAARVPLEKSFMTAAEDAFARGWELHQAGDFRRAEEIYRQLLRTDARAARVWFVLADLCEAEGRRAEAAACFRQAVELAPHEAVGYYRLGNALLMDNKVAEAEAAFRRCLEVDAGHAEARVNLGFVLGEQGRLDEARQCYEQALLLRPDLAEVHHNLGNILREQQKLDEALPFYHEALRLKPDYAKAHINLGVALAARGDVVPALAAMQEGVRLEPGFAEAHSSLGTVLCSLGRLDEALAEYDEAIRLKSDYAEAYWNRSLVWLLRGEYERGWADYEWRWKTARPFPLPAFKEPRWDGGPLAGRTILLYAEQGLGDTLQFIRYAPLVQALGGRVIVQCQGELLPLLSRSLGIDQLVPWGTAPPAFDVYTPLLSLPGLLHTTLAAVPANVPYLFPDPELVAHWRRELAPLRGLRVGIAWQGSVRHPWDRHRSVPLDAFEPLARLPGVSLVSLQQGPGAEQLKSLAGRFPVLFLGDLVDKTAGAFMDTAAILKNLDLVVTVDTALGHLAGGLGTPAWLALHYTPDYRWLLQREDSPWYPTLRLFRQQTFGDWPGVFARLTGELRELAVRQAHSRPVLAETAPGELLDRLSILRIKAERIADPAKLRHVQVELESLAAVRATLPASAELEELEARLKAVNEQLWDIEDAIRRCEKEQDFGPQFIDLARSVYQTNDRRAALKRSINERLHSSLVEEKSYADYAPA